ncbi:MAG TPA: helix-turn-helix domain-containing protein [Segeticoccus sp.]|uniref:AraC family transcriptional regulator n=1 Tax=Segeticoccus sp. TaxID=2706531 RepID=UPI002D7FEF4A|nr:helix-turn-helix domain-containing protein [Segeticoccus sp.]HET8600269.1 helix-turn-helix domain-containing protein [Segeticoccus sp.]
MTSCQNATGRPPPTATTPWTAQRRTASDKGVLQRAESARHFTLHRHAPGPAVADVVEGYWTVRWDLHGAEPYRSEVLPHPAVHLTVETGSPGEIRHGHGLPAGLVHGVVTRRFTIDLIGAGQVVGVKFRPGGFAALTGRPVAELRDRVVRLESVLGDDVGAVVAEVLALEQSAAAQEAAQEAPGIAPLERVLSRLWGTRARDPAYELLLEVVRGMLEDRDLTRVEQVGQRFAVTVRQLQRLFRHYVGVSPKWVLQRYRLHDAAWLLDEGRAPDLAALATELGWADQAHFGRDFAAVLGVPPGEYRTRAEQARAAAREGEHSAY